MPSECWSGIEVDASQHAHSRRVQVPLMDDAPALDGLQVWGVGGWGFGVGFDGLVFEVCGSSFIGLHALAAFALLSPSCSPALTSLQIYLPAGDARLFVFALQ